MYVQTSQIMQNLQKRRNLKFKEYCGYKHEKDKDQHINVKELITNHEQESSTIKNKVNQ